jgi:mannose-6-phosphate isomerase-like protein (cupin superfamily)
VTALTKQRGRSIVPYVTVHESEIEATRAGRLKSVRKALGVTAFGINQITLAPDTQGSLHDESATGQEEVYFVIEGEGVMAIADDSVDVRPGTYVFVPPGTDRQVQAGPGGLVFLCVGSPPGSYQPRS